jgi:hypothetical protein
VGKAPFYRVNEFPSFYRVNEFPSEYRSSACRGAPPHAGPPSAVLSRPPSWRAHDDGLDAHSFEIVPKGNCHGMAR